MNTIIANKTNLGKLFQMKKTILPRGVLGGIGLLIILLAIINGFRFLVAVLPEPA
jgi:hypothetical protein